MLKSRLSFIAGILATLVIVLGGAAAVFIALRTNPFEPVSPTVPQSKPQAAETQTTASCLLTFTVAPPVTTNISCDSITMTSNETRVRSGSETRSLMANISGATGTVSYTWSLTGSGSGLGSLNSTTAQTVIWTAPSSLATDHSWTIRVTASDSATAKSVTSDNCVITLSYTVTRVCNSDCGASSECPSGLTCSSGKCRNPSCVNQTGCTCPTPVCGSSCSTSADCPSGMACSSGACRNPSCVLASDCVCPTVVITPPPTVVVTQPTPVQTHKVCRNKACVSVSGAGTDTCTSDVSCQPAVVVQPIPESGSPVVTLGIILIGGLSLLAAGLLLL